MDNNIQNEKLVPEKDVLKTIFATDDSMSLRALQRYRRNGFLRSVKIGNRYFYRPGEITEDLASMVQGRSFY